MKKIKLFALMLLAGASVFTSCKTEEETGPAPTLTFSNYPAGSYEIDFDGITTFDLSFVVSVTAEEEIASFTAKKTVGGTTVNITPAPADFDGKTSYTFNYLGTYDAAIEYPVSLVFTCTDKADQVTTKTFTVTKKTATAGTPIGAISTYSGIVLGAQQNATLGSFYATSSNSVYLLSAAATNAANVDLGYYYGANNLNTLGAPSNSDIQVVFSAVTGWTVKNATLFVKNPAGFTYSSIDATTDISGLTFGTETDAKQLAAGDLVAFKTTNNKIGFISVVSAATVNSGSMTINVKVQQ